MYSIDGTCSADVRLCHCTGIHRNYFYPPDFHRTKLAFLKYGWNFRPVWCSRHTILPFLADDPEATRNSA